MKTQAMTRGLRLTLSKTELEALLSLARRGADHLADNPYLPKAELNLVADVVQGLEQGLSALRWKQAEARAKREALRREAERRAAREHYEVVEGYAVWATLGDWTDISDDPERRQWDDMFHPDTQPREQGEIRRNVWRIYITRGRSSDDDYVILPGDCTMTADRNEVASLAGRIIAQPRP